MITRNNILISVTLLIISKLSAYDIERIEPPFWWSGFNNKKLQLMVYGKNVSKLTPKIKYKGIQINEVHRVDSPNYLFIDLLLRKDKPKKFTIEFNEAKKTVLKLDYEIFKRQKKYEERETLNSSDVIYLITRDRYANGDE